MATATYVRGDKTIVKETSAGAVAVDTIAVIGAAGNVSVGVAQNAVTAAAEVRYDVTGTYTFPAASGAVIAAGETVNWDVSASNVDDNAATAATGDVEDFGIAVEASGNGDTTVIVKLLPGNGAIS